jgi:transcriptional regulator with XRE-family HTH domain
MQFFSVRLKQLRIEKRMTQEQVAKHVNITRSMISSYETDIRLPSFDILLRLSRLFQVSTDYLLSVEERRYIDITDLDERETAFIVEAINICRQKKTENKTTKIREVVNL